MQQPPPNRPSRQPKKITLKSYKTLLITLGQIFEKQKKFRVYINTNNSAGHTYFVNDSLCFLVSPNIFCRFLSFHTLVGPNSNHLHRSFYSNLHYFKTNKTPTLQDFIKTSYFWKSFCVFGSFDSFLPKSCQISWLSSTIRRWTRVVFGFADYCNNWNS